MQIALYWTHHLKAAQAFHSLMHLYLLIRHLRLNSNYLNCSGQLSLGRCVSHHAIVCVVVVNEIVAPAFGHLSDFGLSLLLTLHFEYNLRFRKNGC